MNTDVLVLGSGLAGMSFALLMSDSHPDKEIVIVSKSTLDNSNTFNAQGGMAVALNRVLDSTQQHYRDTLEVGDGCCDEEVVALVVQQARAALRRLETWGVHFDRTADGNYDLAREGGHSAPRVVHTKDRTGMEISQKLAAAVRRQANIRILEEQLAIDLILDDEGARCLGVELLDLRSGEVDQLNAGLTLLATGGIGQLYGVTTNPEAATGDGIAMAIRAGVPVRDMEFVQFHPTLLRSNEGDGDVLATEALRGAGATLRNEQLEAFMPRYDRRADLASRDVVSRAIHSEMQGGSRKIWLDCREIPEGQLRSEFPNLQDFCSRQGLDPQRDLLPVRPAAHYLCGGVSVNLHAQTAVPGLLACGEVSHTGLHGANRLASNSLLEAIVMAEQAWKQFMDQIPARPQTRSERRPLPPLNDPEWVAGKRRELQALMGADLGVIRYHNELLQVLPRIHQLKEEVEVRFRSHAPEKAMIELRNMAAVAAAIVEASIRRSDNRGCFYKEPGREWNVQ